MAFDINAFVINKIVRGTAFSLNGNMLYTINQIQNASLSCTSESADAVDAMGSPITTFYRAKTAELSAENALFDLSLLAAQSGSKKNVASETAKIVCPAFDSIIVEADKTDYELKHTPMAGAEPTEIFVLKGDSTFGEKYVKGTAASDTEFALSGKTLQIPTGLAAGVELCVIYDYESTAAVEVVNSATEFPSSCKFVMEVLGCEACNPDEMIYAYIIFPNAKLSPDFDWSIQTDGAHPFTMRAQQAYCDKEKKLFSIIVPSDEDENA